MNYKVRKPLASLSLAEFQPQFFRFDNAESRFYSPRRLTLSGI